jgi:hypothetical protein
MLGFFAFVAIWSSTSLPLKAENGTPTVWSLVQNEDSCGLNTVYITHDAVKLVNSRLGCHFIAKAPDWKVHCFQPKDKVEWIGRMEDFSGRGLLNFYYSAVPPAVVPLHAFGPATINGVRCKKYGTGSGYLYVANDISVPSKATEFLLRFYNLPYVSAVPIYSSTFLKGRTTISKDPLINRGITEDLRSGVRVNLSTESFRKVPYKLTDFEIPAHCKRVGSMTSVSMSGDKKSQLNEMLDNVGFMSSTGKNKHKETSSQLPKP